MTTIDLELVPILASPGRFSAHWPGGVLVRSSKQPLIDAARALLDIGEPPETVLTTRQQGSDIVAQRSTVGEAAHRPVTGDPPMSARADEPDGFRGRFPLGDSPKSAPTATVDNPFFCPGPAPSPAPPAPRGEP